MASPDLHPWIGGYTFIRPESTRGRNASRQMGNSLAIRLPSSVVDALRLKAGDEIEIDVVGARAFEIKRRATPRELLTSLRKFRGRMPADFRFDGLEAHERGR